MPFVNNDVLLGLLRPEYGAGDLDRIEAFLDQHDVLAFPARGGTGLYPASRDSRWISVTRYDRTWLRDNVYVAQAHRVCGRLEAARATIASLFHVCELQRDRFDRVIKGEVDPHDLACRPHIRWLVHDDGRIEFEEPWSHAQNDALGYFVWLAAAMVLAGQYDLSAREWHTLQRFVHLWSAITFWEGEDFGHWEEPSKVQSSSIGAVVAGLREFVRLCERRGEGETPHAREARRLMALGRDALDRLLPHECVQPGRERHVDGALLFLIWPLNVVAGEMADTIVANVERDLVGDYGIRRYIGDSFWGPDYETLKPDLWTADLSADLSSRERLVQGRPGVDEAQWCIFDSALSSMYGERLAAAGLVDEALLKRQVHFLNRALGQITGFDVDDAALRCRCPELYYRKRGRYVHNNATPLVWAQANLAVALRLMRRSVEDRAAG